MTSSTAIWPANFIAIDVETANRKPGSICQIGACIFENGVEVDCFSWMVNPEDEFEARNIAIHGISEHTVANAALFSDVAADLRSWIEDAHIVSHGSFDRNALREAFEAIGEAFPDSQWIDSCTLARRAWPTSMAGGHSLKALASYFGIDFQHHDALHDARTAGLIAIRALEALNADQPSSAARDQTVREPQARPKRNPTAKRGTNMQITLRAEIGEPLSRLETLTLLLQLDMNTFNLSQSIMHALTGERDKAAADLDEALQGIRETAAKLTQLAESTIGEDA